MAKLKIFTFPDAVLAQKAAPIARVDKSYFKLADDMLETMYYAPGIGLAANQVGLLERIVVVDTDYDIEPLEDNQEIPEGSEVVDGALVKNKKPIVLINPIIIYREDEILYKEGCLSVPKYSAEVKRAKKIKVEYQDVDGVKKTLDAEDLHAICIQHEIDHLDGKLFIDRLGNIKRELAKKKLLRARFRKDSGELEDEALDGDE